MRRSPQYLTVVLLASAWCCATPARAQITLDGGEVQVTTNHLGLGLPRSASGGLGAGRRLRHRVAAAGSCYGPATAKALSINATAVLPSAGGSLVIFPGDAAVPPTTNLGYNAGAVRANNAIVSLSCNGDGNATVLPTLAPGAQVHFSIDVNGYFQ